jgi:ketopantoate reductase
MRSTPLRFFVVGMGEVGRRLAGGLVASGVDVVPVTRQKGWERLDEDRHAPVLVCVREDALGDAMARLRGVAPERLVFVQNGWIRPLLGELPGCSRGLIWFTSKGEFFQVLRESVFSGPAAAVVAERLNRGGIPATAQEPAAFARAEAEKMGFNCVVGLPLAVHGVSLGEYTRRHAIEAEAVFSEATGVTARALGVPPSGSWWPDFLRVAEPLGWVRSGAPKSLEYRNGAIVRLAATLGMAAPVNEALLAAVGNRKGRS